jgi:hypothetical protein
LDEEKVEEGKEPRITKMYWTYWNGEEYIELEDTSRHYLDLGLFIETKNYSDGETLNVTIKNDDGQPLFDDTLQLDLVGIVLDNKIILENIFNEYTLSHCFVKGE